MFVKVSVLFGGSMFAAVLAQATFSNTVNLGAIMLAGLIIIIAGFFTLRDRLAKNQIEGWKGNFESMKARADGYEVELKAMISLNTDLKLVVQRLEALPNLERVVKLMADSALKLQEHTDKLHRENLAVRKTQHDELRVQHEEIIREIRKIPTPL